MEVACRRFAVLSGIRQETGNYVTCVHPGGAGQRKGLLALVTEPAGEHPALATGASRLVHDVLVRQYYADNSLGLTSGLLKALDAANGALLEYNHAEEPTHPGDGQGVAVAVQAGGVRTRRAQVGLTAALLRPDASGVYLAQMSPTQAYIVHNGLLSALPEPQEWQRVGKLEVVLKRVLDPGAEAEAAEEEQAELRPLPPMSLPSLPLGSGPDVEVDLLYRRMEPGDLLVVVSSSLARLLERPLAEEVFSSGDADRVSDALYNLATERGLAQSHACVLQVGVEATSGVDTDFTVQVAPPPAESYEASGGARYEPDDPALEPQHAPALLDMLRNSRQWFQRRKTPGAQDAAIQREDAPQFDDGEQANTAQPAGDEPPPGDPLHPTQVLLSHSLEVPPYKAHARMEPESESQEREEELEFDGWEDVPPALGEGRSEPPLRIVHPPHQAVPGGGDELMEGESTVVALPPVPDEGAPPRGIPIPPRIFGGHLGTEEEDYVLFSTPRGTDGGSATAGGSRVREVSRRAGAWLGAVLRGVLPEGKRGAIPALPETRPRLVVPARLLIVAGVVVLVGLLALSLVGLPGGSKKTATINTYLSEAQHEDLLANQSSNSATERQQHLETALDKANQALATDPRSNEAVRLAQKAQAALDALQGITRLQPKLLFDLDVAARAGATPSSEAGAPADQSAQATQADGAATPGRSGGIAVQGNDAYVLDTARGEVYRCRVAARDCAVVLKSGDSAGGQKVGSLLAMTLRVGSLVVLDSNLVAYIFAADTSSWQAQPLGDAAGMDKPRDLSSFDGNLYLLAAKPGQVAKYVAGRYGEAPEDWIKDPAGVEQAKNAVAMGIDGFIYVLLPDGKIPVMQAGKVTRTLTLPGAGNLSPSAQLFVNTDTQDLYVFDPGSATITRLSKEGQLRATFKGSPEPAASRWSAMTVDEGRGKLYLLQGRQVYEASLHPDANKDQTTPVAPADTTQQRSQPLPSATAAP